MNSNKSEMEKEVSCWRRGEQTGIYEKTECMNRLVASEKNWKADFSEIVGEIM